MRNLIKYFIKYPIASNVIMLLIIIFGTMGLSNLRKTFFPERTSKLITVQAVYPGASPLEIEQMVTLKIEDNLDGITGIKRVTSNHQKTQVMLQLRLIMMQIINLYFKILKML